MDDNEEIKRICEAFHSIDNHVSESKFFENVYQRYEQLGGERSPEDLK